MTAEGSGFSAAGSAEPAHLLGGESIALRFGGWTLLIFDDFSVQT